MDRQMNGDGVDIAPKTKGDNGEEAADVVGEQGEAEGEMTEIESPVKEARGEEVVEQVRK